MTQELIKALINIQSEIGVIPKKEVGQTGHLKFKYADLPCIWEKLQPLLKENKVFFSQQVMTKNGAPCLVSKAFHESGETMESEVEISHVTADIKAFGGLISYYRRYATVCFFGLVCDEPEVESNDGKNIKVDHKPKPQEKTTASNGRKITIDEYTVLTNAIRASKTSFDVVAAWAKEKGYDSLKDINIPLFDKIMKHIEGTNEN